MTTMAPMGVRWPRQRSIGQLGHPVGAVDMAPPVDEQGAAGEVPTALTAEEHGDRRNACLRVTHAPRGAGCVSRRLVLGLLGEHRTAREAAVFAAGQMMPAVMP